jgi:hypothetical protein
MAAEGTVVSADRRAGTVVLAIAVLAVVAVGLWGVVTTRFLGHAGHPQVGDVVEFDGGSLRVDAVLDVDLSAPMSGPGMNMGPSSGVPDIPDGTRWVTVDLTMAAPSDGALRIDPDLFLVAAEDGVAAGPVALDDGGSLVPAGARMSRGFTYQVPEDSRLLEFRAPGAGDPVMLPLGDAPAPHDH